VAIAPAGYLGASISGAVLLLTRVRFARFALASLAAVPAVDLIFFHPADLFTALWCGAFVIVLAAAAWKLKSRLLAFLQMFLGVEVGLNAFRDLTTLIFLSGAHHDMGTDADHMSQALFLPSIFWAVLWTVLSVALLSSAVFILLKRDFGGLRRSRAIP
jgi:hypothetical protein